MFEISNQIRETRLSPRRAPRRSLLPLSPKRTQVRLKSLLHLSGLRQIHSEPTDGLRCKRAVCGLNGLLPRLARSRGTFHLNPRPLRALAPTASFRGPLCCASPSAKKIWHTIFFSPKPNFKIFPKLLPKPRRAAPSLKNSPVMVLPRCLEWNTSPCLLAKSPSLWP